MKPEAESRRLTKFELVKKLQTVSQVMKSLKSMREHTLTAPDSPGKLWIISCVDNKLIFLNSEAESLINAFNNATE